MYAEVRSRSSEAVLDVWLPEASRASERIKRDDLSAPFSLLVARGEHGRGARADPLPCRPATVLEFALVQLQSYDHYQFCDPANA